MEEASCTPAGREEEAEARPLLPRRGQLPVAAVSLAENDAHPASRLPACQLQSHAGKVIDEETVRAENAAGRSAAFNVELSEAVSAQEWGRHAARGGGDEGDRPLLLTRVPASGKATVSRETDPGQELVSYVAPQPARHSPASAGNAAGSEACLHTGQRSVFPYFLSTNSAISSTGAPCLSPSGCSSASATSNVSVANGPFLYAWRARRLPNVQAPVQGLRLPQSAGETTVSAIAYDKLTHTVHERTSTATAATGRASETSAASGGAAAGGFDGEHRVVNRHSSDAATTCETVVVCEGTIDSDCGSGSVSRRKTHKATDARRRGTALVPQGFSLAHVPAGFLWGRTRLGALRLVYRSAGTPDCLVLVGPNWSFALAMFFLHVLVVAFFLYVFLTAFKDWSPFAGGLILCLATFYGFLSTVFKDPGLPLDVSLVELQPRLLSSATARLRVQDASRRQVQRRLPRVLRGVRRAPWRFQESSLRRPRMVVVGLLAKKREFRRGSSLSDGKPGTPAAETKARRERRTSWFSSHGTHKVHSRRSAGCSAEDWGTAGQSGGSRDADATSDGSCNSSSSAEEMSAFDGETGQVLDEEGGDETCTTKTTSRFTKRNRIRRVPEAPLPAKRLLPVSLRAKEGLSASASSNRPSHEDNRRLLSHAPSAFVPKNVGDLKSVLRKKGRTAMTSAPQALGLTFSNVAEVRVQLSTVKEGRRHVRRRTLVGPPAKIGPDGLHRCRVAAVDPNAFTADAHPQASQSALAVRQSQRAGQALARKHSRRSRGCELEFSPLQNRPRTYDVVGKRAEGYGSDSMQTPFCAVCGIAPPPGAYHCEECRVCIEGYDHHCPWTSKCVGKGNSKEFYTWVVFALVTIMYFGMVTTLLRKEDDAHGAGTETREAPNT